MAKGSKGAGKSLVRATLAIHEPPIGNSTTPGALIKTFELRLQPGAADAEPPRPVEDDADRGRTRRRVPEFMGPEPREMTVEIFLDSLRRSEQQHRAEEGRVADRLLRDDDEEHRREAAVAALGGLPVGLVLHGPLHGVRQFRGGELLAVRHDRRADPGHLPGCTLHEIPSKTKGQNPTSGALTAQRVHRVVAGDSLQSLAWREYGDAAAWRAIAEANGIDNPGSCRPAPNSCCRPPRRCVPDGAVRLLQRHRREDRRRTLPPDYAPDLVDGYVDQGVGVTVAIVGFAPPDSAQKKKKKKKIFFFNRLLVQVPAPGDRIVLGQACGEPTTLVEALIAQGPRSALRLHRDQLFGSVHPETADSFALSSMGAIGALRSMTKAGKLAIIPVPCQPGRRR